jgi:hypothetical protein
VNDEKYIDVHQATISVAVTDATGKVVMESGFHRIGFNWHEIGRPCSATLDAGTAFQDQSKRWKPSRLL